MHNLSHYTFSYDTVYVGWYNIWHAINQGKKDSFTLKGIGNNSYLHIKGEEGSCHGNMQYWVSFFPPSFPTALLGGPVKFQLKKRVPYGVTLFPSIIEKVTWGYNHIPNAGEGLRSHLGRCYFLNGKSFLFYSPPPPFLFVSPTPSEGWALGRGLN